MEGEVRWNGKRVLANRVPDFRRNVCYVPQRMSAFDGTVRETLQLPFSLASWSNLRFDERKINEWLATFQRERSFLDKTARELSGGEFQLVRLLLALQASPTVLLFDEPTAAMDAKMALCAEEVIRNWIDAESSRAYAWISHSDSQIERVATRQVTMKRGRLGVR
ncbi:ATP-binding cassette domain-containing protein [Planctomycetota bacterium]